MQSVRKHNDNKFIGSSERKKKKQLKMPRAHRVSVWLCGIGLSALLCSHVKDRSDISIPLQKAVAGTWALPATLKTVDKESLSGYL